MKVVQKAHERGGCLLLNESSAESSCMSFLHYFHAAISNHLSVKAKNISCFIWSLKTGLTVILYRFMLHYTKMKTIPHEDFSCFTRVHTSIDSIINLKWPFYSLFDFGLSYREQ